VFVYVLTVSFYHKDIYNNKNEIHHSLLRIIYAFEINVYLLFTEGAINIIIYFCN
jgi:hypothetical protein